MNTENEQTFVSLHCSSCQEDLMVRPGEVYDSHDGRICENCHDDYSYCDNCGESYHRDNLIRDDETDLFYCADCYNGISVRSRPYSTGDELVTRGKRAFSVELETYYPNRRSLKAVADKLPKGFGFCDDGSLGGSGKEFQSPKLSGEKGEKELKKLCTSLIDNGFTVNRSCGLHIHLDTKDFKKFEGVKSLFLFYLHFEPVIYSFLPFSRRNNNFCKPLSQFYQENEIATANNLATLERIWYRENDFIKLGRRKLQKYDDSRYAGVNFHSMLANGHIEIRHHSGTLQYEKIIAWARLHSRILDLCSLKGKTLQDAYYLQGKILQVKYILDLNQKRERMFDMLELDNELRGYFTSRAMKFSTEIVETPCAE